MLSARDITKVFRGRRVLDGVELRCDSGQVCAVLGENGTGKSTLLRVLCGMLEPDRGQISIRGHQLTGGGVEARRHLGYVPDGTDTLPDLSLRELSALVRSLKQLPTNRAAEQELLRWRERLGLAEAWHQRLTTLSFGQRKRACTLVALLGDPWLLILDEPSNGLDPAGVALLVDLIEQRQRQGMATVLASNDMPFVEQLSAQRQRLQEGRLVVER
ncbi:MAG: ABC transporter ATP-binding protein [Deltaproteobacteria bacterium]